MTAQHFKILATIFMFGGGAVLLQNLVFVAGSQSAVATVNHVQHFRVGNGTGRFSVSDDYVLLTLTVKIDDIEGEYTTRTGRSSVREGDIVQSFVKPNKQKIITKKQLFKKNIAGFLSALFGALFLWLAKRIE